MTMKKALVLALLACFRVGGAPSNPLVFPVPRDMQMKGSRFPLEEPVRIILPAEPSENDWLLARELAGDLGDRRGINVRIEKTARLPVSRSEEHTSELQSLRH